MKYLKHTLVALGIIVLGLAIRHFIWEPARVASTEVLYSSQFPDSAGNQQKIEQWRGKILVVNFWATWCPPCREEMPELSQLHEHYRDKGVLVLGIASDDAAKIQEFSKETKVSYPLLAADLDAMRLGQALGNDRDVLPYTVIINQHGDVVKAHFGRVRHTMLEETLVPLLAASASRP